MANKHVVFWSVALGVLFLDRISKLFVLATLPLGASHDFGFFAFTHLQNTGTFFGLGKSAGLVLGIFAALVCLYIGATYHKHNSKVQPLFAFIFAGALGNLVDRLLYGSVIDFVDIKIWPVFNVADAAISLAIIFLLYDSFFGKHKL